MLPPYFVCVCVCGISHGTAHPSYTVPSVQCVTAENHCKHFCSFRGYHTAIHRSCIGTPLSNVCARRPHFRPQLWIPPHGLRLRAPLMELPRSQPPLHRGHSPMPATLTESPINKINASPCSIIIHLLQNQRRSGMSNCPLSARDSAYLASSIKTTTSEIN